MVRRIVGARVGAHPSAEDLVQETLVRVFAAPPRIEPGMLEPYAIATARNVVASMWRERTAKPQPAPRPRPQHARAAGRARGPREEQSAMAAALARLSDRERRILLAHEVDGTDTRTLAERQGSTAGAVAAQLNRTRARLAGGVPAGPRAGRAADRAVPTGPARPVQRGDRRRQREVDAAQHLLECELVRPAQPAPARPRAAARRRGRGSPIGGDPDIVAARRRARELAGRLAFTGDRPDHARDRGVGGRPQHRAFRRHGARSSSSCSRSRGRGIAWWPATPVRASPTWTQAMATASAHTAGWASGLPGARRLDGRVRHRVARPGAAPP